MSDMFPNHPKSGEFFSLKGGMVAPYEAPTMESSSEGDSRHQAETMSPTWNSTIIVDTPTTTGSGATNSPLEGHA
jgi:hypothetical protein